MDYLNPDPLTVTVPVALHDAMTQAISESFAVSYLCGAVVVNGKVLPRTRMAHAALSQEGPMRVLRDLNFALGDALRPDERKDIKSVSESRARYLKTGKF